MPKKERAAGICRQPILFKNPINPEDYLKRI